MPDTTPHVSSSNDKQSRIAGALFLCLVSIPTANWLFGWNLLGRFDRAAIGISFWLGFFLLLVPGILLPEGFKSLPRRYGPLHWYIIIGFPVLLLLLVAERLQQYMPAHNWLVLFACPIFAAQAIDFVAKRSKRLKR